PERTDIRVQYANMLKDAGRPAEAEAVYRQALTEAPAESDTHLQLGHALKLQGRHNEAVAAYRRAATLRPDNTEALRELFFAGSAAPLPARHPPAGARGGVGQDLHAARCCAGPESCRMAAIRDRQ